MKPFDEQELLKMVTQELESALAWHEFHQRGFSYRPCSIPGEDEVISSLALLYMRLVTHQPIDSPMLVERFQGALAWHQEHLARGCSFKTQGEDGHIENFAEILSLITGEKRYTDIVVGQLLSKLSQVNPEMLDSVDDVVQQFKHQQEKEEYDDESSSSGHFSECDLHPQ